MEAFPGSILLTLYPNRFSNRLAVLLARLSMVGSTGDRRR